MKSVSSVLALTVFSENFFKNACRCLINSGILKQSK